MPFKIPDLETLKVNTNNLETNFSIQLGRYRINPSDDDTLKLMLARINHLTSKASTDRESQLQVFTLLANEMRDYPDPQRATMILLGGLLHRYFRLIEEYDNFNKSTAVPVIKFNFFKTKVTDCGLFIAIREALQLPSDSSNYRIDDLNVLDGITIVTALECFKRYMVDEEHYKKYPHFNIKDLNFATHLKTIIDKQVVLARPLLSISSSINFLQSLKDQLYEEHYRVVQGVDLWVASLKKTYPDFKSLDYEKVKKHIEDNVSDSLVKVKLILLIGKQLISNLFTADNNSTTTWTYEQFSAKMKLCNLSLACHAIVGGYFLVLDMLEQTIYDLADKYKLKKLDKDYQPIPYAEMFKRVLTQQLTEEEKTKLSAIKRLRFCIHQVLDLASNPDSVTKNEKYRTVHLLRECLHFKPQLVTSFFGGLAKFETAASLYEAKLITPEPIMNAISLESDSNSHSMTK